MFKIRYKSHHDVKNIITKMTKKKLSTPWAFSKLMKETPEIKEGGIYVHTPYCDKICAFCNMNRKQLDNNLDDYTEYLCKEFEKYGKEKYVQQKEITTIFFGGGTPTIYRDTQIEKILSTLRKNFNISDNCEFTFETTLHNLTLSKLKTMEKNGVNRISIGIQTFSDRGREVLNRTYDKTEVIRRMKEIRENYSGLICIDIIYNYLDETLEEVKEDAKIAVDLGVDSISFYSLMIHDGSKIAKDLNNEVAVFDYTIEMDKTLHDKFLEVTMENGYKILEHTKITNGKDEYRYIKNVNLCSDLFAIGVGAGGRVKDIEYYNLNKMMTFYAKDSEFKYNLKKFSGLLQYNVVKLDDIKKLIGEKCYSHIYEILVKYNDEKLIELSEDYFRYTIDGVFWGNSIVASLIERIIILCKQ